MRIEHIAMYVNDLEKTKDFFVKYFQATSNEGYHNEKTDFYSYFLSFDDGARLEIMKKPQMKDELKTMVKMIRETELSLGDGEKKPSDSELKNKDIARKSIVAKKSIKAGEIFSEDNITCKRPGNGISPMKWNDIIGQTAKYDFEFDEQIRVD